MQEYTESQKKIIASAHTALSFVAIVTVVALGAWLFLRGLSFIATAVIPVAAGFFLALFFKPYYHWLERKVRVPALALLLLLASVLVPIGLAVWWSGGLICDYIMGLVGQVPEMIGHMSGWIASLPAKLKDAVLELKSFCGSLGAPDVGPLPSIPTSGGGEIPGPIQYSVSIPQSIKSAGIDVGVGELMDLYSSNEEEIVKKGADLVASGASKLGKTVAASVVTAGSSESGIIGAVGSNIGWAYDNASGAVFKVGSCVVGLLQGVIYVLVTCIFFVYFLMTKNCNGGKIANVIPLLKDGTRRLVAEQIDKLIDILVSFYQRQTVISLLEGCLYGAGFWLVGLPYGFLIGFILGCLNLIPFFGSVVCLPFALALAYFGDGGSGFRAVLVLIVWLVCQFLDGYYITPKIQGDKTGLGYAGVIFSFLFWPVILGPLLGLLLAIPLSACCVVLWRTFCDVTKNQKLL